MANKPWIDWTFLDNKLGVWWQQEEFPQKSAWKHHHRSKEKSRGHVNQEIWSDFKK